MKSKLIASIILTASIIFVMCAGNQSGNYTGTKSDKGKVATFYYDLPAQFSEQMKTLLNTGNLAELDKKSHEVFISFIKEKIFSIRGIQGSWISTNYFWNIYNALPDFVNERERHQGYYRDEPKPSSEERLMAYACYRIKRSPENISRIFRIAKPKLKELISVDQYNASGGRDYVSGLIGCYNRLHQIDGVREKLSAFYSGIYTETGAVRTDAPAKVLEKYRNSAYGFSGYDLAEMLSEKLKIDRYSSFYSSPFLSFWMRRNREGNIDETYRILCEIERMYE